MSVLLAVVVKVGIDPPDHFIEPADGVQVVIVSEPAPSWTTSNK